MVQVAAGDQHSACVTEDGSVHIWGYSGQLGQEDMDDADLPVLVLDANATAKLE